MFIREVIKMFESGNVCVVGLRRRGKDMLFGNVIARRNIPYVSNTDYKPKNKKNRATHHALEFDKLDCGKNFYRNFITGDVNYYEFPYPEGTDVYIADCGVYLPAQYCNELNRDYKHIPTFMALSAQLGACNVHTNCQNLGRIWDKLREQSDMYIMCNKIFRPLLKIGIVLQQITIYEKYESCNNRVPPFKMRLPMFAKRESKSLLAIEKAKYELAHGLIKRRWLLYVNKSDYNTTIFKEILKNGKR